MEGYTTVKQTASFEYEDRKSVFIGDAMPVSTEEDALRFLDAVKKRYPDARHHVYAYVLRENSIMRFSDDHEPQGTAGMPVLDSIRKNGVTDVIIVVTRYFGGTLLGKGGLKRAYTDSGREALEAGEPVTLIPALKWRQNCSYSVFEMLSRKASQSGWTLENVEYGQDVAFDIIVPVESENELKRVCLDLSGGALVLGDSESLLMMGEKASVS